jgi:transposase
MYSYEVVFNALDLYNKYKSYNQTALILNLYRQTVTNWVKKYKNNLKLLNDRIISNMKNNFNVDIKFNFNNQTIIEFIKNTIKINPFLTKKEMRLKIVKKFNIKISNKKLSLIYKKLKLTKKKVKKRIIKDEKFIDKISEDRTKFINKMNTLDKDKIISIDETGINNVLNRLFGYSEKGYDINIPITNKKNKNNSIIIALTISGIIHYDVHQDSINVNSFNNFIINVINKLKEKNYIFIFDNIKFHQNNEILNLIINNGHQYIFVPSYSPDLNPIENVNGILKQTIDKLILTDITNDDIIKDNINHDINHDNKIKLIEEIKEKRKEKNKKLKTDTLKIKNENMIKIKLILKEKNIDKDEKKKIKEEYKKETKNIIMKLKKDLNNELKKT